MPKYFFSHIIRPTYDIFLNFISKHEYLKYKELKLRIDKNPYFQLP